MDLKILIWFHETFHSVVWLNYVMKYITYIGEFGAAAIVTALILILIKKTRYEGLTVAAALIIDVLVVNVLLKLTVNRARPWTEYPDFRDFYTSINLRLPTDSSFPSGHTAACFCAAVALTMCYKVKAIPALVVAFLVALSRLYLCVHYPTDVLGGVVIGSAAGVGGYYLVKLIKNKFIKNKNPPA